jgi:hypothetical protein
VGLYLSGADQVAWSWIAAGFFGCAVLFGPVAKTVAGQRIDNWLRGFDSIIQKAAVAVVILLAVAVTVTTVPEAIGRGFTTGAFLFVALSLTANALFTA